MNVDSFHLLISCQTVHSSGITFICASEMLAEKKPKKVKSKNLKKLKTKKLKTFSKNLDFLSPAR